MGYITFLMEKAGIQNLAPMIITITPTILEVICPYSLSYSEHMNVTVLAKWSKNNIVI